jgi:hypothetical protein
MNTKRDKPNMISYHRSLKQITWKRHLAIYSGAVAWNNLPSEIKNSETVNIFKVKLKIINWEYILILLVFVTLVSNMYVE